ncbi:MAG: SprT family zinc-dependent metalloprotease [Aliarcobacter sp.]|jgi:predicted metal-dependent hydrolase|nr:SprT family zinc-dependent metalloprotease [Aliarcobacter sp.]
MSINSLSSIVVSGLEIIIERKDIKNLHIGVYPPNGKIRVATPLKLNDEAVRLAVISRLSWIKKQQQSFLKQPRQSKREMITGESHYFFGKRYLLDVKYQNAKYEIIKKHSKLQLFVKENTTVENRLKVLEKYYRDNLTIELDKLINKWQNTIEIKIDSWKIQKMKTQWGSCNIEDKRLIFNLELAKVPIDCIEYIVVHEMLHLLERHHNYNFKVLMDKYLSDWQSRKEELKGIYISV